jgi:glutathione S-transferase
MRVLYHYWLSPYSRKVAIVLGEKKLDFDLALERYWERRPEFLALSPAAQVPILVEEDGTTLTHSQAICEYLDECHPEPPLLGENAMERAEIRRLAAWFDEKFYGEVSNYLLREKFLKRFRSEGQPDANLIRAALHNITHHMDYVSYLIDRRNWLAGEHYSLADIAAAAHLSSLDYLGDVAWDKHPIAKDWFARVKSRPSFRRVLAEHVPGMPPPMHYADLDF